MPSVVTLWLRDGTFHLLALLKQTQCDLVLCTNNELLNVSIAQNKPFGSRVEQCCKSISWVHIIENFSVCFSQFWIGLRKRGMLHTHQASERKYLLLALLTHSRKFMVGHFFSRMSVRFSHCSALNLSDQFSNASIVERLNNRI